MCYSSLVGQTTSTSWVGSSLTVVGKLTDVMHLGHVQIGWVLKAHKSCLEATIASRRDKWKSSYMIESYKTCCSPTGIHGWAHMLPYLIRSFNWHSAWSIRTSKPIDVELIKKTVTRLSFARFYTLLGSRQQWPAILKGLMPLTHHLVIPPAWISECPVSDMFQARCLTA